MGGSKITLCRASTWANIQEWIDSVNKSDGRWVFRGLPREDFCHKTSFERLADSFKLRPKCRSLYEKGLLRKFKRHFHHYVDNTPAIDDTLEWWSVMQHHGAPTRLLDWTYSPWIALFFANEPDDQFLARKSAVWAINMDWLLAEGDKFIESKGLLPGDWKETDPNLKSVGSFNQLFFSPTNEPEPFVYPINPYRLNERLILQQGVFLCPTVVSKSFANCLENMGTTPASSTHTKFREPIRKLVISPKARRDVLKNLMLMNVSRASLFPGLDGFSFSLREWFVRPEVLGKEDGDHPRGDRSTRRY